MRRIRGFTLLELMIVVLVIAILAGIAISGYSKQIRKSRRAEAKQTISAVALREEKWRSNNPLYLGTDSSSADQASFGNIFSGSYYTVAISTVASGTAFTITATPIGDQVEDSCGTLSLQTVSGVIHKCPGTDAACSVHTPEDCW